MMPVLSDEHYMAYAQRLALRGFPPHPNPRVGCVVVSGDEIVGEGWHKFAGEAHAEVIALQNAGERARAATMYITLEPCCYENKTPPCTEAVVAAGIARVVVAMRDPNPRVCGGGIKKLKQHGIKITEGVGAESARQMNLGFCKLMEFKQPWVTLKMAASLDGKSALADGTSKWITSPDARADVHRLRAKHAAVMTGIGSVLSDDPQMTARCDGVLRQPLRVIIDRDLKTPHTAKILCPPDKILILTAADNINSGNELRSDNVEVVGVRLREGRLDLRECLNVLAAREINSLLVEAGARLSGSFISENLFDEIIIYIAADLLGGDAKNMFELPKIKKMSDKHRLRFGEVVRVGEDLRLSLTGGGDV